MGGLAATSLIFAVLCLSSQSQAFDLFDKSGDTMIMQGDEGTIFCEADEPYDFCKWSHTESGKSCKTSSERNAGDTCEADDNIEYVLTETSCGIKILNAARTDSGTYTCGLVLEGEEMLSISSKITV